MTLLLLSTYFNFQLLAVHLVYCFVLFWEKGWIYQTISPDKNAMFKPTACSNSNQNFIPQKICCLHLWCLTGVPSQEGSKEKLM